MVVEAGLGGRYDASNVLDDAVVVLTNVSREHTDLLGDTEREIAAEKLAVVPDGGERLVIGPLTPAAQDAVRAIVRERGLSAWWAGTDVLLTAQGDEAEVATPRARYRLDAAGRPAYQLWNMALAVAAGERRLGAPPPQDAVRTAVAAVDTPGRFEVIPGEPTVILDGAHNPAAMEALAADLPEARPLVAVLSVLRDKDLDAMLAPLAGRVDRIVATASTNARVLPADELHRAVARKGMTVETVEHPVDAVARARQLAGPSGVVIVCGSLYLLTDVRGQAIHRTGSPPGKLARETPGNGRN